MFALGGLLRDVCMLYQTRGAAMNKSLSSSAYHFMMSTCIMRIYIYICIYIYMYIYIYGFVFFWCVELLQKAEGGTSPNHTPESYPRIIPRIIPPNHTP